jgi:hypothetical protein
MTATGLPRTTIVRILTGVPIGSQTMAVVRDTFRQQGGRPYRLDALFEQVEATTDEDEAEGPDLRAVGQ